MTKSVLERRLDLILDDNMVPDNNYQEMTELYAELEEARRKVSDLERELMYLMNNACSNLALGIRKQQPGLNVGVDGGQCKVGYKNKNLSMRPDASKCTWIIKSSDPQLAHQFTKSYNHQQDNNLQAMAQTIANFFTNYFKSIGEDIVGHGIILVEGKSVETSDLVRYARGQQWI